MRSPAADLGGIPLHLRPGGDGGGRLELAPLPTRVRGARVARERAVQARADLPRPGKPWPFAFGGTDGACCRELSLRPRDWRAGA